MSPLLVFLVYICTVVTEIRGQANPVTLWNIDEVHNSNKLFTGMAYQIQDPLDPTCNLAWHKVSQMFMMKKVRTPVDTSSIFYLVHAYGDNYYLKSAVMNGAEKVVTKCLIMDDGVTSCYLTIERTKPADQLLYASYQLSPEYTEEQEPERPTIPTNMYILDQTNGDMHFEYGATLVVDRNPHIQLRFVPLVKLESELIGIKVTSPPMNNPDSYISQNKRQIWRETIINPTAMTRQKIFKRQTVEVPDTETITPITTTAFPYTTSTPRRRSVTPEKPKGVTETVDVEERITIPAYSCMDIHLMTEPETILQQDIDASLKVSGKVTRFGYGSGVMRKSKLVPGIVVEQVLKEENFEGKYMETRESEVIYEISGKLTSERGIHSTVISREIDCPNTNKRVLHAPPE